MKKWKRIFLEILTSFYFLNKLIQCYQLSSLSSYSSQQESFFKYSLSLSFFFSNTLFFFLFWFWFCHLKLQTDSIIDLLFWIVVIHLELLNIDWIYKNIFIFIIHFSIHSKIWSWIQIMVLPKLRFLSSFILYYSAKKASFTDITALKVIYYVKSCPFIFGLGVFQLFESMFSFILPLFLQEKFKISNLKMINFALWLSNV